MTTTRLTAFWMAGALGASLAFGTTGCELLTAVDRNKIAAPPAFDATVPDTGGGGGGGSSQPDASDAAVADADLPEDDGAADGAVGDEVEVPVDAGEGGDAEPIDSALAEAAADAALPIDANLDDALLGPDAELLVDGDVDGGDTAALP